MRRVLFFFAFFYTFSPVCFAETFIIDTPGMCVQIEKVENNRVYLKKPSAPCPVEGPGKASVEMDGTIAEIDVYVNGTAWRKLPVPLSSENISSAVDRATKEAGRLSFPENVHEEKAVQAAQDVTRFFRSKEFREKVDSMKQQLYRQAGDDHREDVAKTPTKAHKLSPDERLYLFVSSSVPVGTLRNYVRALSHLADPNIRIVLRGFVNGASRIGPTMSFLQEVLFVDPNCDPHEGRCSAYTAPVIIDPLLFRRYHIERVPAFVYIPSVSVRDEGMSEGIERNTQTSEPYVLYGDISLDAAVRLFAKEKRSQSLEELLRKNGQ